MKGKQSSTLDKKGLAEKIHGPFTAWIVLASSLIVTIFAWFISSNYVKEKEETKFNFKVEKITEAVQERIKVYQQVLFSTVAFMKSSEQVTRDEWKTYVTELKLEKNWPGIQGLGYSIPVKKENLQKHIDQIRAEGFPDFKVNPPGDRDTYSSIIYLEPFDWRNKRAFGYDMWSNDMRREAMTRARDTGKPSKSGLITLVQETDDDVQKGFLVYLPFYEKGMPLTTIEERRKAFKGWVYGAFRAGDYMKGILSTIYSPLDNITTMKLYDEEEKPENLLYSSEPELQENKSVSQKSISTDLGGRHWILSFNNLLNLESEGSKVPKFIAIAVITIDLLLFYVILSLFSVKKKAAAIANEISSEINSQNKELNLKQEELIKAKYIAEISQKRVQTILDNTVDGITSIDEKGQIVTFNQACEKLFQYKVEEVIGKNVNILMPEPYHSKHDDYLKRYLDTGEAKIIGIGREVIGLRKDGSTFPMDLSISAFMDGDEQTFIGIVRDITERKNSQNKMEKMVGELTVSNTDLERFAYVASHDLQEPIRMVTNFTQLLKEEYSDKLDDDGHTYIKFAHEAAIRMHNLIAGLLEYSKLSGDRPELTPVDLNNTLNVVKENLMQKIADNKAAITNENLPTIILDEIQAVQLFQNLIANAINYQKAGNTPIINISVIESANKWEIRIADNGIGIDEKYFEKIFSPFKRLHSHAEYQGTGIGLSVCKKIVENAGGSLSLTSVKGDGTTFTILLPKTFTPIEDLK